MTKLNRQFRTDEPPILLAALFGFAVLLLALNAVAWGIVGLVVAFRVVA